MTLQRIKYTIKGGEDRVISKNQMRNFLMFFCVYVFKPILKPQIEKKKFNQQCFGGGSHKKATIIICLDASFTTYSASGTLDVSGGLDTNIWETVGTLKSSHENCKVQATKDQFNYKVEIF